MSRLAEDYLSRNFNLHHPIRKIESDLANGYMLCIVCEQLGLIDENPDIRDSAEPSIIMKNFKILTKGLSKLAIKLSKQEIAQVATSVFTFIHN